MVKLQWLQVNRFRAVKPGTRLTFNAGHNVLLGRNGTGKTMLLDLIAAVVRSDFTDFAEDVFDLSYALVSDKASMTVRVRQETPHSALLSFSADFVGESTGSRFKLDAEGPSGSVQRIGEAGPGLPLKTFGLRLGAAVTEGLVLCWSRRVEPRPKDWLAETFSLFNESGTRRFDEGLGYFDDLGKGRIEVRQAPDVSLSGPAYAADSLEGRVTLRAMRDWSAERHVLTDAELPFLRRAVQLLDVESAEAVLEVLNVDKEERAWVLSLGHLAFSFRQRSGRTVPGTRLSHGQKRMLAFAHHVASTKSVLVADELVNGLHPQWIRAAFEMMAGKQVFLTGQNPLLFDYLGLQSVEDVQATFILCHCDQASEQLRWKHMSEEAARDFFDSYMLGFQRVGELLQTKGLW